MPMLTMPILISVIIPAFKAEATLARAVASIARQFVHSHRPDQVEVIIAADDGGDYGFVQSMARQVKVLAAPGHGVRKGTGPGATRNRGIRASRGQYLAFLDADDHYSDGYLDALLALARRHGAAFAPTQVITAGGDPFITLGADQSWLTPRDFGKWPGSFHPFLRRDLTSGFDHGAGQDVFHALEVLGQIGGRAPMAQSAHYNLNLQDGSLTAKASFGQNIDHRYQTTIQRYHRRQTALTGTARLAAIQALHQRRGWNKRFLAKPVEANGFYGFLAENKK